MSVTAGLIGLGDVRIRAAAALAPQSDTDPDVLVEIVDSVDPPCLLLIWDDPWLQPMTFRGMGGGRGYWSASFTVRCIASRVEPGPGVETLEGLVAHVLGRLLEDDYAWPASTTTAPRGIYIGNVPYLFSDVQFEVPVTI